MRHYILALALLTPPAFATDQDSWVSHDKAQHFAVSAVFGYAAGAQWPESKPKAFAIAMIPGVAKELLDMRKGGTGFSSKDLAADALGAAIGVYAAGWMLSYNQRTTTVAYTTQF
jgi:uncharacterized protein YfiM (DUF2279 family)